jgi:uncharacterized protein YndB with AHSA1/START domain
MAAEQSRTEAVIEHEVRIEASAETVFEFFTDPRKMVQWMGTEATLDPRPGGVCRINPSGQAVMAGEFVEIETPRRIVFTWGWETALLKTPPQSTLVEVSLEPDGDDTVVHLSHRRLKPETVALHRAGWHHYLARLALIAAGADPGRDPWRDLPLGERELRDAGVLPG